MPHGPGARKTRIAPTVLVTRSDATARPVDRALAKRGSTDAVEALTEALAHPDLYVRASARTASVRRTRGAVRHACRRRPFAPAAAAGIHRLAIPTPFAVGRVNVYLIEDQPLTLVDAGPNSGTSFDELQRGIEGLGHALEDIELVIITHQHIDHLALVSLVAARSGAEVAAIDAAVPIVENFSLEAQADDEFARDTMLRHGVPEDVVAALQSVSRAFRAWARAWM
jgi:hypothetical protein